MGYCNIVTKIVSDTLPEKYDGVHAGNWDTSKDLHKANGWRVRIPAPPVEAGHAVINVDFIDQGDSALEVLVTRLQADIDAELLAQRVATYGPAVGQLGALLDLFGLSFPTSKADATPAIYAACKANPSLTVDSVLLLATYQDLLTTLTDAEIYEISKAL